MNNRVVMALIGRYFQKKMEKFGIIECWRYGMLHIQSVGRQTGIASNNNFVAFRMTTVRVWARSAGTNTRGESVVVGEYGRVLAPAGSSFETVGQ